MEVDLWANRTSYNKAWLQYSIDCILREHGLGKNFNLGSGFCLTGVSGYVAGTDDSRGAGKI